MPDTSLIAGPYHPPRTRAGRQLYCAWRGDVLVAGTTDAPVPWPYSRGQGRKPLPVLTGGLIRAVQVESVEAVAYHWGVSRWTVRRWRHYLAVARYNPGTLAVWRRQTAKLERARAAKSQG